MSKRRLPKTGEVWGWDHDYEDGISCPYFVLGHTKTQYWYIHNGQNFKFSFLDKNEVCVQEAPALLKILYGA